MVLVQKRPFFQLFFFRQYRPVKCVLRYSKTKKNTFYVIKTRSSKSRKNEFFSKGVIPWFWSKNGHFSNFLFLGNIGQENVFYDILEQKNRLSTSSKQEVQKVEKMSFFSKGLTHGFGPKKAIFPNFFFLGNIGQENVFHDILERKKAFLGYKKRELQKVEKLSFFQRG